MEARTFRTARLADVDAVVGLVERAYRGESSREGWCTEADLIGGQRVDAEMVRSSIAGPDSTAEPDGTAEPDSTGEPDSIVLLLEDDDGILACCELRRATADRSTLGMFAVDPRRQAGGIGRSVLERAEIEAVERWNVERMELTVIDVRESLIDWYERRGYARTGERRDFPYGDDRFGLPRVDGLRFAVLEKRLRPAGGMLDGHV